MNRLYSLDAVLMDAIIGHHHALAPRPETLDAGPMRLLLLHLYVGARDPSSGRVLLDAETLAEIEGVPLHRVEQGNYVARDLLIRFRETVDAEFRWARHSVRVRPRTVARSSVDPDLARRVLESDPEAAQRRVIAADGRRWSPTKARHARERSRAAAIEASATAMTPEQAEVLSYLNGLPFRPFADAVTRGYGAAREAALALPVTTERDAALAALRALREQPQPFYRPSGRRRTLRVFGDAAGLLTLKKSIRRIITAGWFDADLAGAQTAIHARLWGVDCLLDAAGDATFDLWQCLMADVLDRPGFDRSVFEAEDPVRHDALKRLLKRCVYSIQFGAGVDRCARRIDKVVRRPRGAGMRFLANPLVAALVAARDRCLATIETAGGAFDAFGRWLPTDAQRDARSIAAEVAQSSEFDLMLPLLRAVGQRSNDVRIALWQHDGVCLHFMRGGANELAARRAIQMAVQARADELGIPTRLVIEPR